MFAAKSVKNDVSVLVLHFSVKKLVFRDLFMIYTSLSISDYRETGRLKKVRLRESCAAGL